MPFFFEAVILEEGTTTRPRNGGHRTPHDGALYLRRTEFSTAPLRKPENLHLQKCRVWVDKAGGRVRLIKAHIAAVCEPVTSEISEACLCCSQCLAAVSVCVAVSVWLQSVFVLQSVFGWTLVGTCKGRRKNLLTGTS